MIPDDKSVTELSAEEQANVVKTALSSGQGGESTFNVQFPNFGGILGCSFERDNLMAFHIARTFVSSPWPSCEG